MEVGFIANPVSGKDIRRLTAGASVFDNQEKAAIVRRCVAGIEGVCPSAVVRYYPDSHQIARSALASSNLRSFPLDMPCTGTAADSTEAAVKMNDVDVLVSLGGDGTNRAIAKSLASEIPLVALSTGTNNAFPTLCEATSAGMAAAYVGLRRVSLDEVSPVTKCIHVRLEDGQSDIALIDVVGTDDRFIGSRALVDPAKYVFAVLSVADPSKVGMTAIGGMVEEVADSYDHGLAIRFRSETNQRPIGVVAAAAAPGLVASVAIEDSNRIELSNTVRFRGASALAFDGERELVIGEDQWVSLTIERDGPRRVDVVKCLRVVAGQHLYTANGMRIEETVAN